MIIRYGIVKTFLSFLISVLPVMILLVGYGVAPAATNNVSWDGGAGTTLWSDAANWDPNGVPNNTGTDFYNVTVGRGYTVDITGTNRTIDSLILSSGTGLTQTVNIGNHRTLTIVKDPGRAESGLLLLHGVLNLNSAGNYTQLSVSGDVTVSGSSVLQLGNSSYNLIGGSGSLTNNLTTIQGAGQIGYNQIALINNVNSRIFADFSGSILDLDPNATGMVNRGTLAARNGGILQLTGSGGGVFDNGGTGLISALKGSQVKILGGALVTGGTLSSSDAEIEGEIDGEILLSGNSTLRDLTNTGTIRVANGQTGRLAGTITNNGEILINSSGNGTILAIDGSVTLGGTGTVTLGSHSNSFFRAVSAEDANILTNSQSHTIEGVGSLGENYFGLVNEGLITANINGGTLSMDLRESAASTRINNGIFQAENGGTLTIHSSGIVTNTSGIIQALDASNVTFNATTIEGGTLLTEGSGVVDLTGNATLSNLTNGGTVRVANGQTGRLAGTITNNGEILINSSGNGTILAIDGSVTLGGTGTVTLGSHSNSFFRAVSAVDANILTNSQSHTIEGIGSLGENYFGLANEGLITANINGGTLSMDLRESAASTRINNGTFQAENGGTLYIHSSGVITNTAGVVQALDASNVTLDATTLDGGTTLTAGNGIIDLRANGTLSNLINEGTVRVANGQSGILAGTITNNGEILINSTGNVTDIRISGAVTLAGNGDVTLGPNSSWSRLFGVETTWDTNVLTNSAEHTLQGAGQIGVNYIGLNNQGLINANQSGATLEMDLRAENATRINSGTFQAENGGTLYIHSSGIITNTNGIIQAQDVSKVTLNATTIEGGTLLTEGNGVIDLTFNATLSDLINEGTVRVANGQSGVLVGTITNNGEILINSTGSTTDIRISEAVTLAGSGILTMGPNSSYSRLFGVEGTATTNILTNSAGHTLQGAGQLGVNYIGLDNQGLITANASGSTLTMDLREEAAQTRINTGTLQAANGGTLLIQNSGAITNTGGIIEALDTSRVRIYQSTIEGGTLQTEDDGIVDLENNATLRNLTNNGTVRVASGEMGVLAGTITNNGEILINSTGSTTDIRISEAVTLAGSGVLTMGPNSAYSRLFGVEGTAASNVLTNSAGHTLQGVGQLGINYMGIVNEGLILANQAGTLSIDPRDAMGLTNNGTLQVNAGNTMNIIDSLNNFSGNTLTGGTYNIYGTAGDSGIMRLPTSSNIYSNAATILLDGINSHLYNAGTGTTSALANLATNTAAGRFTVENGRSFSTSGAFSNAGVVQVGFMVGDASTFTSSGAFTNTGTLQMRGGTFAVGASGSLTNTADGEVNGYGTVSTTILNHGLVCAGGGNLTATVDGQSGTVQIDPGASLTLSGNSDASYLIHNGTTDGSLALGTYNFTVDKDYTNASFGTGNSFDRRAHVTGSGQIIGNNADQSITGDVIGGDTATVTMDLGKVRGGTSKTVNYQIANTGTGADIRGAVQTAVNGGNITDGRLSGTGVTAANFGPIAPGSDSGNFGVTFTASTGGELTGQSVAVVSNFDNVTTQVLSITGLASSLAQGNATPNDDPVNLGSFHVAGSQPSQDFSVENTTPSSSYAERLGIGSVATTGNFSADNNLGAGFINGGATQANAVSAAVNNGVAGINTGSVTIQYTTNGTLIDPSFTTIDANAQTINLAATGYNLAAGSVTPTPVVVTNQRIGGTERQALNVANLAPVDATYTETLSASFGANTGDAIHNGGTVSGIAGGSSDGTALQVGVDTSAAGARTGTVTVNLTSNEINGSGLGNTVLASENVTVSGNVYRLSVGDAASDAISFGNVHLNDTASQHLSIFNTAVADVYSESLGVSAAATGNAGVSGTTGLIVAGGSSNALNVSLDTSVAGDRFGTVDLTYTSDGTGTSGFSAIGAGSEQVGVSGTVYRLAEATIDNAAAFNFGAVHVGDTLSQAIQITNTAVADDYSEALNASFGSVSDGRITTNGGSIGLLAAGGTNASSMVVGVNTSSAGILDGTVTLNFASDGTGTSGLGTTALDSQDLSVTASISASAWNLADPVINTAQPIAFGNYRVNDTVTAQAVSITNDAPDDGFSEKLNASVGATTGGVQAAGSFNLLAAQATNATDITVRIDTTTAGNKSGTATLNFVSDGAGTSELGQTVLPSQAVSVTGAVYRLAEADVTPDPVVINARVNDVAEQTLAISNTAAADGYSENLDATFTGTSGDATASGVLASLVAAGTIDNISLKVGLDTSSSGIKNGTATLSLASDGAGTSGFSAFSIGSETIDVQGKVYAKAISDVTDAIDFGIVHVGDTISAAVSVGNTASGALTDTLTGNFGAVTSAFTGSGSLAGVVAGGTDTTSLTVGLDTSAAGVYNGTATVSLLSHNADMADLDISDEIIALSAQVNAYADPIFQIFSDDGELTGGDNSYLLDFGTIDLGSGSLLASLKVANDVSGPADLLEGVFTLAASDFGLTGFGAFSGIGAGEATDVLSISLPDAVAGVFSGTITLNAWGTNESGYRGAFEAITLTLSGTIRDGGGPQPIPEPGTLVLLAFGLLVAAGHMTRKCRRN